MTAQPSLRTPRGVGAAFPTQPQAAQEVQPSEGPLHDRAACPEPGAVLGLALSDGRLDAAGAKLAAVIVVVIAAVGDELVGPLAGAANLAADRPDAVDEGQKLGDVVAVTAGQRRGQRDAGGVGQEVVLGARSATVNGRRPGSGPLERARMWLPSTTAALQPIAPAALRRSTSVACTFSRTHAACQSLSRRHAVTPEQLSSRGRCRHAIPVTSTNTIALNATRSGTGRCPWLGRTTSALRVL